MSQGIVAFDTTLGTCAIRWTAGGVAGVRLPSPRTAGLPRASTVQVPSNVQEAIQTITALLEGQPRDLGFVRLDETGLDPLRRSVYAATRSVAPGTTATYGEIAKAIGRADPAGARDVGAVLAANPFPIVVPCHRVVGANGKLTGFSAPGGLATKRRMLELEGAPGFGQGTLFE